MLIVREERGVNYGVNTWHLKLVLATLALGYPQRARTSSPMPMPMPMPPANHTAFCDGMPMDMSMGGFVWGHARCMVLFFKALPLDSPARFYLGVAAVLAVGFTVELLTYLRRGPCSHASSLGRRHPKLWPALGLTLFAVQTTLAYALMLAVMTYELEMLLAAIGGLTIGHGMFNLRGPVPSSADPCCVEPSCGNSAKALPAWSTAPWLGPAAPLLSADASAPMSTTRLHRLTVGGMVCAGCSEAVRSAIAKVEGVVSVSVDLQLAAAEVVALPGVSAVALLEAVRATGKTASLP